MNTTIMTELEILNAALAVGFVKFSYYKKDGSHRIAIGTTNAALARELLGSSAEYERRLAQHNRANCDHCIPYFDLSRGDFRCFIRWKFDRIELERMTKEQAVVNAMIIAYETDEVSTADYSNVCDICRKLTNSEMVGIVNDTLTDSTPNMGIDNKNYLDNVENVVWESLHALHSDYSPFMPDKEREQRQAEIAREKADRTREKLIAELMEIRARESEILMLLLK